MINLALSALLILYGVQELPKVSDIRLGQIWDTEIPRPKGCYIDTYEKPELKLITDMLDWKNKFSSNTTKVNKGDYIRYTGSSYGSNGKVVHYKYIVLRDSQGRNISYGCLWL